MSKDVPTTPASPIAHGDEGGASEQFFATLPSPRSNSVIFTSTALSARLQEMNTSCRLT